MVLKINIAVVLIGVVINFILGFVWFAILFAKAWIKEMGYDPDMRPDRKAMAKGISLMLIGSFLFVWVYAFYLAGWKFIPGTAEIGTISFALNSALSVWFGFFVPVHLSRVVWEKHSWKLFGINSGYHLVTTVIISLILASWP